MPRITNSMLVSNYMNSMNRNLGNMSILQNQLSSGKNIQRASENPYTATRMMQLNSEIAANKQYNSNINDTSNWLDTTDTALAQAGNVFSRIRELMVKAGNGAYGPDEIATIKDEIVSKTQELGTIINSSFDGNYIFGGTKSTSKPVNVDDNGNISYADKDGNAINYSVTTNPSATFPVGTVINDSKDAKTRISELDVILTSNPTDADAISEKNSLIPLIQMDTSLKAEISQGVTVDYNKSATDILEFTDPKTGTAINVSDVMKNIIDNLGIASSATSTDAQKAAAISEITGTNLTQMDAISSNLLQARASVGAMQNRMESAKENNEDQNYNMTSILSKVGDVDFTEKTMEYAVAQTVYTASLQTSAKVLSKTLLDYL